MSNKSDKCFKIWAWIIQVLLWIAIPFLIISLILYEWQDSQTATITTTSILYIIYVITNSCSPMCKYLFHKYSSDSIHKLMKNLFYNPPVITFRIECYHYETRVRTHRDSKGNTHTSYERRKVTTWWGSEKFNYFSWRDISGLFLLDSGKVLQSEKKVYIKLALSKNFQFADDITRMDYQRQKDLFYSRNRWRDTHCSLTENRTINGFNEYNMVRISDKKPPCISGWAFLFFTYILPFSELFKMYINTFCVEQDYSIKKVLSTRYNLVQQEHAAPWVPHVPTVAIFDQPRVVYEELPAPLHDNPVLPSMDDLENAKSFTGVHGAMNENVGENYTPYFNTDTVNNNNNNNNNDNNDKKDENAALDPQNQQYPSNIYEPPTFNQDAKIDVGVGENYNKNFDGVNINNNNNNTGYSSGLPLQQGQNNNGYSSGLPQPQPNQQEQSNNGYSSNSVLHPQQNDLNTGLINSNNQGYSSLQENTENK